jgi:hypothetical protein
VNNRTDDLALLENLTSDRAASSFQADGPAPPADDAELSPEWCTEALRAGGSLGDATVVEVRASSLGEDTPGFFGVLSRLHLTYDSPGAGPATVVAKRNSPEEFNRAIASSMGYYERECRVYSELAAQLPLRLATTYYSALDGDRFVLLMEDLGAARVGRQSSATSVDDVAHALTEIAAMHGAFLGHGALNQLPWLTPLDANAAVFDAALATRWQGFVDSAGSTIRPEALRAAERLLGRMADVLKHFTTGDVTLVHGDFRIDNVLFDLPPDPARPLIIDWQAVAIGTGVFDAAQLIALSLDPDTRRQSERSLLDGYAGAVEKASEMAVDRDELFEAYRLALAFPLAVGIAQSDMDTHQAGSDTAIWVHRASEAVADHGLPDWLG